MIQALKNIAVGIVISTLILGGIAVITLVTLAGIKYPIFGVPLFTGFGIFVCWVRGGVYRNG